MPKSIKETGRSVVARTATRADAIMPAGWGFVQRLTHAIAVDPTRAIAISLLITACASTAINALYLQTAKYPAPLFGEAPSAAPAQVAMPDVAPVPVPRSAAFANALSDIDVGSASNGFSAPSTESAAANSKGDSIGELIATMGTKPPAPNRTVLLAQKALNKLGYSVKADGVAGGTTRQAIEKFERDNRLPVRGELTPKLLRELSMSVGFAIE